MEKMRKEIMRDGDPMAAYFQLKKEKQDEEKNSGKNSNNGNNEESEREVVVRKPKYKGPVGAPNRFRIVPGIVL